MVYLKQVKYEGLPLEDIQILSQIRDEILEEAIKKLQYEEENGYNKYSCDEPRIFLHFLKYVLYPEMERNIVRGHIRLFYDSGRAMLAGKNFTVRKSDMINRPQQEGIYPIEGEIVEVCYGNYLCNVVFL